MIPLLSNSKKKTAILLSSLTLGTVLFAAFTGGFLEKPQNHYIVMRVDDVQDFAFRDAQLLLLKHSIETHLPLSLAIICGMFGEDAEVMESVRLAVASGSEVGVHGWKHENLVNLSIEEQKAVLSQSKSRIRELFGIDTQLLIPPMFSFDNNTISAMHEEGYNIISTCTDYHKPSYASEIRNIPATVELSTLTNGVWEMKSVDTINAEVEKSFEQYGYTVIVTHPQEFISNGRINQVAKETFTNLLAGLGDMAEFTTFENLKLQK